jgi:hypothetical protein
MGSRLRNRWDPESVARGGLCSVVTAAVKLELSKIYSVEIMANNMAGRLGVMLHIRNTSTKKSYGLT